MCNTAGRAAHGKSKDCEEVPDAADGRRCRSDVVPALVDKSLGAARAGTKKKGAELCAMFVEVENTGEGVMVS